MQNNLSLYKAQVSLRQGVVDGLEDWNWVTADKGAFDGPLKDWIGSHKEAYTKYLKGHQLVIQAGGNCGMYPVLFSQLFDQVYTFEPDPLNFYTLVQNCQLGNIIKIQAALGNEHRMVGLAMGPTDNVGMHQIAEKGPVPQLCIDDFAWPECDLIQLDIEQYEIYALRGAQNTIQKFRPVISVENDTDDICKLLKHFEYVEAQNSKMDTIYVPRERL